LFAGWAPFSDNSAIPYWPGKFLAADIAPAPNIFPWALRNFFHVLERWVAYPPAIARFCAIGANS